MSGDNSLLGLAMAFSPVERAKREGERVVTFDARGREARVVVTDRGQVKLALITEVEFLTPANIDRGFTLVSTDENQRCELARAILAQEPRTLAALIDAVENRADTYSTILEWDYVHRAPAVRRVYTKTIVHVRSTAEFGVDADSIRSAEAPTFKAFIDVGSASPEAVSEAIEATRVALGGLGAAVSPGLTGARPGERLISSSATAGPTVSEP